MSIISLENIGIQFGKNTVLSGISFTVEKGEYIGLIGPNGAGKSTLLKIILGSIVPSAGVVKMKKNISFGYVPQDYFLTTPFSISVEEVILMASSTVFFWKTQYEKKRTVEVLKMVGLEEKFLKKNFQDLSGGQKQRVIIARSLFHNPDVLLFDEPLSGVDFATKLQIYELLADLNTQYSTTIIFVSHEIESVVSKCHRILCLNTTMQEGCHPMEFVQGQRIITPIHHHHSLTQKL
ncbi:TPA: ATP-binding cassette domain-containing protein [Candidatus Gracilibacteria bacterium]|nr:ATP-binding cassette domain-containing protein [Candidatus Peregrinibacteria bacterium]HIQ57039.1 ATP-binding cassette domain-containing protein [Candidatus Gracilibacteria bacterium]HIQ57115.1 ATP-binding cassette domain-containing protein [Candidatus Gracilibacteria bacterium]